MRPFKLKGGVGTGKDLSGEKGVAAFPTWHQALEEENPPALEPAGYSRGQMVSSQSQASCI